MTTYTDTQRKFAADWKAQTSTLPADAKLPAPYRSATGPSYEFCLPWAYADHNLLPEVRSAGIALFGELKIPWHMGIGGGPGNHLLSSQVQCVNALGQMVNDPARIVQAFGESLGTEEVFEIEPGRYLTFEYIGPVGFFSEGKNGVRERGANCTSVDAAFVHRTKGGLRELVLLEWKYTESYRKRTPEPKDEVRRQRYEHFLDAADSPVRRGELSFLDLLDEPFYQLMRQQLLAHELEKMHAADLKVDRVRVAHVLPESNLEYQQSIHRETQRKVGESVYEVWDKLLTAPDRFVKLDSAMFLDPAITSAEYVARYGATASA